MLVFRRGGVFEPQSENSARSHRGQGPCRGPSSSYPVCLSGSSGVVCRAGACLGLDG